MRPTDDPSPQPPGPCATPEICPIQAQLTAQVSDLERRATFDALTGLWNRSHFDSIVEQELARSLRHRQPLSLVLFDVDHFKRVNDGFGHQAGDAVLCELATVVAAAVRSSDAVFRWGGEEFAVLATTTGHRGAARLAEALRAEVAEHAFPGVGSLTISLGVAEHMATESAEVWFERTDAMLYAAKRRGRNTVCVDAHGNSDEWVANDGPAALRLVWQEAYECGNETIDREHRELFGLANQLIDAFLASRHEPASIAPADDRLIEGITRHFADEESLLAARGYSGLEAHRRMHARLVDRARQLRSAFDTGGSGLGNLVEFLATEVVARHIFKADRVFFPLFATTDSARTASCSGKEVVA